jgi:hypothetical protein
MASEDLFNVAGSVTANHAVPAEVLVRAVQGLPQAIWLIEHAVLAACYDAAARGIAVSGDRAGQPTLRLITSPDGDSVTDNAADEPVAEDGSRALILSPDDLLVRRCAAWLLAHVFGQMWSIAPSAMGQCVGWRWPKRRRRLHV